MAPKKNYLPGQMKDAIEAVKNGAKIAEAAQRFGVPRITLFNKVTGKSPVDCAMGPKTILSQSEEQILVKWLEAMSERHFPVNRELLLESVQKIVTEQGKPNPFTNNKPGKKWFQSFLKRHPQISEKNAQNLSKARDDVTGQQIRMWFSEIETYLEEKELNHVLQEPSRIFNTDESAFFLSPKAGKVLCKKGEKHLYKFSGDEKENLTVLLTANAAGQLAPPLIVFKYERVPAHIAASVPDDWGIGKSESGWMCGSTFYEYMTNIFAPWLEQKGIEKPVIFFLDGHKSHLTLQLSSYCSANKIEVIALYPNSTHILQPMDLAVFRPLKVAWRKEVSKWQMNHIGQTLKKENFAPVLKEALSSISEDCIRNGFRAGGLHPFGPDYIDMTKIKHRQGTTHDIDPRQTEFIQYLEFQIVQVYSRDKLELFKNLYFKDRNTLEQSLPIEDESLYVIWAKNKHVSNSSTFLQSNDTTNRPTISPTEDLVESCVIHEKPLSTIRINKTTVTESSNITSCSKTEVFVEPSNQKENSDVHLQEQDIIHAESVDACCFSVPASTSGITTSTNEFDQNYSLLITPSPMDSNLAPKQKNVASLPYSSEYATAKFSSRPEQSISNDQLPISEHPTINPSISFSPKKSLPDIQQAEIHEQQINNLNLVIPNKDNNLFHREKNDNELHVTQSGLEFSTCPVALAETPQKHTIETALGTVIPSPFKNNLFWPEEDSEKKKRKKEKIPFTVTSKAWKDYHTKKQLEKKKLQEQKEERARQRLEKTILKEKNIESKKKRCTKSRKKSIDQDTTSEDSDLEITYAESENSNYNEEDDDVTEDNGERAKGDECKYRKRSRVRDKKSDTKRRRKNKIEENSEDEQLSILKNKTFPSKNKCNVQPGQFVIVKYESEFFPGRVEAVDNEQYEISTMVVSTGNSFRWPDKLDKIWYEKHDLIEVISEPSLLNKRGFYKVKEMDKYLPDLYNI